MKFHLIFAFVFVLSSCQNKKEKIIKKEIMQPFYVGTYTNGDSQGIYKYGLKSDGTLSRIGLAAKTVNPSFLTFNNNKKYLLAVNEIHPEESTGTVSSFLIKGDSLQFISKSSSGGADPCFISTNNSDYILTANYTSGSVGLLKMNKNGELSELLDLQQHTGKGTTERQKEPHAHSAWFDFDQENIITVDLGTNQLWLYQLDKKQNKLLPSKQAKIEMDPAAGPRHLTFHPNKKWIYVINELSSTVTQLQKGDDGRYKKIRSFSTLPDNFEDSNTCADIHISSDGKFVYASNRGHNSIAIFKVNLEDGALKLIGFESTKGSSPRNFSLSPNEDFLLVANQLTNNIVSFKRDKNTGLLKFVYQIEAPTPVCILFK